MFNLVGSGVLGSVKLMKGELFPDQQYSQFYDFVSGDLQQRRSSAPFRRAEIWEPLLNRTMIQLCAFLTGFSKGRISMAV